MKRMQVPTAATSLCLFLGILLLASNARSKKSVSSRDAGTQEPASELQLPVNWQKYTGDLDGMLQRHQIRALVVPSHSGFFYDEGRPHGIYYEALNDFQQFANQRLHTGNIKVNISYIPVRPDQLERALLDGTGDVIAYGVIVTPERAEKVSFTNPIDSNVKEIVVTGPKVPALTSLDDLSGKEICVNPLTDYYQTLLEQNQSIQKAGRAPISIKSVDPNLTDEDLLEMANANLIPATITINVRAKLWGQVLPKLKVYPDIVLKNKGQLALATRKDSPKLNALLNEFIKGREVGTSFGNTLVRRYLDNPRWVKDATSTEEMRKFEEYVAYFKKYGKEYNFDYLMLMAQGYQESGLDQNARDPSGAIGIMQVIPKFAAASPINITDVNLAEGNIHAGAKMLRNVMDTYLNDPNLDPLNKTLLAFAAYNAGPTRISNLRKKAAAEGLNPNKWFGNVELVVAQNVGQQTVQYVSNIFKYYVAYKMTIAENSQSAPAM
jgi:membrane-bound lytic murein transglycosylase MltF